VALTGIRRSEPAWGTIGADDGPGHPAAGGVTDRAAGRPARPREDRRAELHAHQRDPGDPHKPAAWLILRERLLELGEACDGLTADAPEVLARVRQQLAAFAARLGRPGAVGQEPQADVPARTIQPPAGDAPVPSFERDIRPLFRERDRAAMRWAFDLGEIASVRQHAEAILEQVIAGRIPCDAAWLLSRTALRNELRGSLSGWVVMAAEVAIDRPGPQSRIINECCNGDTVAKRSASGPDTAGTSGPGSAPPPGAARLSSKSIRAAYRSRTATAVGGCGPPRPG
jgi:hypothetical protein